MLQKKNIYGMMVQQALKHAIASGKKEILFQCGDANELAQWNRRHLKPVTITAKNYKKFQKDYEEKLARFGPTGCKVGDYYKPGKVDIHHHFVTAVGPDSYQVFRDFLRPMSLLWSLEKPALSGPGIIPGLDGAENEGELEKFCTRIEKLHREEKYNALLTEIKNSLRRFFKTRLARTNRPAELARLKKILPPGEKYIRALLDRVWHEFGYDKFMLKNFPALKKMILNTPIKVDGVNSSRSVFYYNSQNEKYNYTLKKSSLAAPEIGKTYLTPTQDKFNINFILDPKSEYALFQRTYNWYEKTLLQEFKKYGLGVEKVPVQTIQRKRPVEAHAWKVNSGVNEFKRRPLTVFSTRAELKMDCETLPRLQAAAAKFACPPEQLTIVNDFLTEEDGSKKSGAYAATGEIRLANHSLGILAHEGLHKLKAKGVIPAKEYRALVRAGKQITRSRPEENKYINQRDKAGNYIYPPGRVRNEEYAAIFVETYYENNALARKNLMGDKLRVTEKVLDYIKTLRDIIQSRLRMPAARARSFLRRVEKGLVLSPPSRVRAAPADSRGRPPHQISSAHTLA